MVASRQIAVADGLTAKIITGITSAPGPTNDNTQGYGVGSILTRSDTRQKWVCDDATTNAAVWTALELSDHPGYIVGNWYNPAGTGILATGTASGAGSIRLAPLYIKQRVTINALGLRVNTLSAAGNVQAAIYASNPSTQKPTGTPLASTTSMSTGSVASVSAAISLQLEPGLYWFASNCDNGTAVMGGASANSNSMPSLIGSATQANGMAGGGTGIDGYSFAATFGTWSDLTAASLTELVGANSIPVIQFKIGSVP